MLKLGLGRKKRDESVSERASHTHRNGNRQGDRVSVTLPIQIKGLTLFGDPFLCEGWTEVVSQQGGTIVVRQNLSSDQEITVRGLETGQEAEAYVVRKINRRKEENAYAISLLNSDRNPWGIEFPPRAHSAGAVGRIVLECMSCHRRELAYLDAVELEALESNGILARFCKHCRDSAMWKKSFDSSSTGNGSEHVHEKRREVRKNVKIIVGIRSQEFGEDLVHTRNASRTGLCFESRRPYQKDCQIQVAVPYSSGGGNIFRPARIVWVQNLTYGPLNLYGVSFSRKHPD